MLQKVKNIEYVTFTKPVPYKEGLQHMKDHVKEMQKGQGKEQIWSFEHPHVYTAGTSAKEKDLLSPDRFPIIADAGRGGQWTYHGPGQRILWVMLDLTQDHGEIKAKNIRALVRGLEMWIMQTLNSFSLRPLLLADHPGIWIKNKGDKLFKIASIGLRVTKWVSWHGVSINLDPDLDAFNGIVPCGIKEYGVTSLKQLNPDVTQKQFDTKLIRQGEHIFKRHFHINTA